MVPEQIQLISGLGNVPVDWKVLEADEISTKITKGTTPPKSDISNTGEIPFLRVNNLSFNGTLDASSTFIYVSKSAHNNFLARSKAYPGDVLMNIVGPPLGKTSLLKDDFPEYNMNQAIVFYRLKSTMVDNKFFLSFLNSSKAQDWLQSRSKKTSGQQNLTIQICKELPVPIPPLPEQKKIAKILSTWDKAISTTEQLLANSQQQKKALMQQLLTGKKRLLDENGVRFSGEWEEINLGKSVKVIGGNAFKSEEFKECGIPVVRISNIKPDYSINMDSSIFVSEDSRFNRFKIINGDILIAMSGATTGKIGMYNLNTFSYLNQRVGKFEPIKGRASKNYLFQLFKQPKIQYNVLIDAVGGAQPNISNKDIERIKVLIPALSEQQKIAAVLSTADQEITVLQQKLNALKQEKKSLMQQLLTGKRRVKVN